MRIAFPASHAYPGARAEVSDIPDLGPAEALVEFADGVTVIASCNVKPDLVELEIPSYRTLRGAEIAAHTWILRRRGGKWRAKASGS